MTVPIWNDNHASRQGKGADGFGSWSPFSQWLMVVWVTPVNLGIYAAWIAFKSSVRGNEIEERIDLLESYCFQTKASFKVKGQYRVG